MAKPSFQSLVNQLLTEVVSIQGVSARTLVQAFLEEAANLPFFRRAHIERRIHGAEARAWPGKPFSLTVFLPIVPSPEKVMVSEAFSLHFYDGNVFKLNHVSTARPRDHVRVEEEDDRGASTIGGLVGRKPQIEKITSKTDFLSSRYWFDADDFIANIRATFGERSLSWRN